MAKKGRSGELERALRAVADADVDTPDGVVTLKQALAGPHPFAVARAATRVREHELSTLVPDLLAAYTRLFDAEDPSCSAKAAIAETLDHLEYHDGTPFLRGITHVQMEAGFGGGVDVATALRVRCGFALARLSWPGVLDFLADLLGDPEVAVRVGAAQAIGYLGHGSPLLRLKLHGKDEPEVLGECLAALCRMDPEAGLRFGRRLLESESGGVREAAAIALGESRIPAVLPVLVRWVATQVEGNDRRVGLIAIGLLRLPAAVDHLIRTIETGDGTNARAAVEAVGPSCFEARVRDRVTAAIGDRPGLLRLLPRA